MLACYVFINKRVFSKVWQKLKKRKARSGLSTEIIGRWEVELYRVSVSLQSVT